MIKSPGHVQAFLDLTRQRSVMVLMADADHQRREVMKKSAFVVAAIVATAAALGACRKEVPHTPMKLGASNVTVAQ
ncbi:MAG: hypothetical protein AAFO58_08635 [Pseudomonadota bacterium]